jgi:hypothetical protein
MKPVSIPSAAELQSARERAEAARLAGDSTLREFYEARAACLAALIARFAPSRRERERDR